MATTPKSLICDSVTVSVLRPVTTLIPVPGTCSIPNVTSVTFLTFLAPRPWWPRPTWWQGDSRNAERVLVVVDVEAVAAALKLPLGHDVVSCGKRECGEKCFVFCREWGSVITRLRTERYRVQKEAYVRNGPGPRELGPAARGARAGLEGLVDPEAPLHPLAPAHPFCQSAPVAPEVQSPP